MIAKINDGGFVNGISRHQTFELIKKFKEVFPSEEKSINLLERVNLMTPENIHLNSFMYEPILDMSNRCVFRAKPATDSDASRPPIPTERGH